MSTSITIKANLKSFEDMSKLVGVLREEVIEKGLDKPIQQSLPKLKKELKDLLTSKVRSVETITPVKKDEGPYRAEGTELIDISKSEETIIKHITKGKANPEKSNKSKDSLEYLDAGMIYGKFNKNASGAGNRITLRLPITPGETVESQRAKAESFFKTAFLAIPESDETTRFFMPTKKVSINKYVKIKCSHGKKDSDSYIDPKTGKKRKTVSEQERFDLDSKRDRKDSDQPYAEWTLYQSYFKDVNVDPKSKGYIEVSDVISNIKEGNFQEASNVAKAVNIDGHLNDIVEQTEKIENNDDLDLDMQGYRDLLSFINGLKVEKKIKKEKVDYYIVSQYNAPDEKYEDIIYEFKRTLRDWIQVNFETWWKKFQVIITKVLRKYGF